MSSVSTENLSSLSLSSVPKKLWVKYEIGQPVKVPTSGSIDVGDFVEAIRGKLQNCLGTVDPNLITLHLSDDALPLKPGLTIADLVQSSDFRNTSEKPLFVRKISFLDGARQDSFTSAPASDCAAVDPVNDPDSLRRNHYRLTQLLFATEPVLRQFFRDKFQRKYGRMWQGEDAECRKLIINNLKLSQDQKSCFESGDLLRWDLSLLFAVFQFADLGMMKREKKNIKDLKSVRNACMHAAKGVLTKKEFQKHWGIVCKVLKGLPGGDRIDTKSIAKPETRLVKKPIFASFLADDEFRFEIRKLIVTGRHDISRYLIVNLEESTPFRDGSVEIYGEELNEDHTLLEHVQNLRQLREYVAGKGDDHVTMSRVVLCYNRGRSCWSYCLYQVNLQNSQHDAIFNEVSGIPLEKFASDDYAAKSLASCIEPYTGSRKDFKQIHEHLVKAGVKMEDVYECIWKEEDQIYRAISWLESKCYAGRIVNQRSHSLLLKHYITQHFKHGVLGNNQYVSNAAIKIALVACGYRIKIYDEDDKGLYVLSNVYPIYDVPYCAM